MNIPIIKLEVQGMKYAIHTALAEHSLLMDKSIQAAVEEYCTPGNIDRIVKAEAMQALDAAVKEEVRSFFGYGAVGRKAVREAVHHWLNKEFGEDDE